MLIQYLIKQSRKPSGLVGRLITNIWSSYFKELSLWATKQTTIPNNSRILEIGYGGGSTIKNLLELDKILTFMVLIYLRSLIKLLDEFIQML